MQLIYRLLADFMVVVHFAFVLFAIGGGFFVRRWGRLAWLHLPSFLWATLIALKGWICPLTPLENWFRVKGGEVGYGMSFVEHYVEPLLYPALLTRNLQILLGLFLLILNLGIYGWIIFRRVWGRR